MSKRKAHRAALTLAGLVSVGTSVLGAGPASASSVPVTVDVLAQTPTGLQVSTRSAPDAAAADLLVRQLQRQSGVVSASVSVTWHPLAGAAVADPDLARATFLQETGADRAWTRSTGEGVVVAVLDQGVDPGHPDLAGALLPGADLAPAPAPSDHEDHGTAVAGTIAARRGNGIDAAGVAPGATILPVRVCTVDGCGSQEVARGVLYAVDHGARVINLSLGGPSRSSVVEAAISYAVRKGVVVVASSGNGGSDCETGTDASADCGNLPVWPAHLPGVISVSSASSTSASSWATHDSAVALSAPGAGVYVLTPGGGHAVEDGTSFSAPQVAGAAADVLAVNPALTPDDVRRILTSTAAVPAGWNTSAGYGAGILDVAAAVDRAGSDGVFAQPDGSVRYVRGGQARTVAGAILGRYRAAGGERGLLRWPVTDEIAVPGGAYQVFEGAFVVWSPATGAQIVYGDNLPRWLSLGATRSVLGFPSSEEIGLPRGVVQRFTGGNLYWTPATGSQEVHGAILGKYASLGWERGSLGYPTTNEVALAAGAFSAFEGGTVYWSPSTGAHVVKGAILHSWGLSGWENGSLGYPRSDEYSWKGGIRQDFQGASLFFSPRTGKVTLVR